MLRVLKWTLVAAAIIASTGIVPRAADQTRVVLLGTGTPRPDPARSGPATVVTVGDRAYLVDIGPGVVRRAAEAARTVQAARPENLKVAFVTHLHSDHTMGLPDLIFTPWVVGHRTMLDVYGPRGIKAMTDHVLAAWSEDVNNRTRGLERESPTTVRAHEIHPGVVFSDDVVKVTAFPVLHGEWKEAFGYKFETPDRTIVISGDTRPSPALVAACNRCDVLIHEAYLPDSTAPMADWPRYRVQYHTSITELAEIARRAQPGLLIIYHRSGSQPPDAEQRFVDAVHAAWSGKVVVGHDLDVY